ncbi:MAG: hypothetical protein WDO18_01915 [Acidobacteriota bacterium]
MNGANATANFTAKSTDVDHLRHHHRWCEFNSYSQWRSFQDRDGRRVWQLLIHWIGERKATRFTPAKTGYTFNPVNRAVTVNGANTTANFTATQKVWGISGVVSSGANTSMKLTGPVNLTNPADATGNYSFAGLVDGNYTVTPTLAGYTFNPVSQSVTIAGGNRTAVNFTATKQSSTWSITGTVTGGANSTINLTGAATKTATADASGNFSFTGLVNGSYTVTPGVSQHNDGAAQPRSHGDGSERSRSQLHRNFDQFRGRDPGSGCDRLPRLRLSQLSLHFADVLRPSPETSLWSLW